MFDRDVLKLEPAAAVAGIGKAIREQVHERLRRRGAVVGVSGGIDSSVVAALCARALGPERVLALQMPERDSGEDALRLGRALGAAIGVETRVEDIDPVLAGAGCYERQDEAIRMVFPDYVAGWRFKVVLPTVLAGERLNVSKLTVERPDGTQETRRLPLEAYLQLIAATNFKQRARTMLLYYHADRLNYAVAGTPNRLEYDQGFFVKGGDGARGLQAHRPPLQDAGLPAGGVPGRAGGDPPPPAHHRRPSRCRRRRRSSTSACPTTSWTCACTGATTACRRPRWRPRPG